MSSWFDKLRFFLNEKKIFFISKSCSVLFFSGNVWRKTYCFCHRQILLHVLRDQLLLTERERKKWLFSLSTGIFQISLKTCCEVPKFIQLLPCPPYPSCSFSNLVWKWAWCQIVEKVKTDSQCAKGWKPSIDFTPLWLFVEHKKNSY